ncbi:MAG: N-acetylmuramoyl-L-alanine amidase, partial [Symbiobacteriaceae bacterium]
MRVEMEGAARLGFRFDRTASRWKRWLAALVAASVCVLASWAPIGRGAAVASAATVPKRALVTASSLNMRQGPGTSYAITGKLAEGTLVTLLERKGSWFRVSGPNNLTGWVDGTYLTARLDGIRIVVDPGHGGSDGGAYANGIVERDVNLKISQFLEGELKARGAEVRMTRTTWKERPALCNSSNLNDPSTRTGMANSWPANMLLSVHNNASSNTSTRGMMTIWGNAPQSYDLAKAVLQRTLYWTNTRQGFDHVQFAKGVYRDTEIRRTTLAITNCSKVPATIIEVAFLTNKEDAALLKQDAFLRAVAKGIADGAGAFILNRVPDSSAGGGTPAPPGEGGDGDGGGDKGGNGDGGDGGDEPGEGGGDTPANPPEQSPFPDVGGQLGPEVLRAHELGLVNGYPDGRFYPEKSVTRGEFAKMVVRAVEAARGEALPKPATSPFRDVRPGMALYDDILKAAHQKYILGYEDGTFRPDLPIAREQAAAILQRVAGVEGTSEHFADVPDNNRFAPAVAAVAQAG